MPGILRVDQANVDSIYAKTAGGFVYIPGHVIQYVDYLAPSLNDNYTTISSNTVWDTPVTVSITPKRSNSKLVVRAQCPTRIVNALGIHGVMKRDGNVITQGYNRNTTGFFYKDNTVNHHWQVFSDLSVPANSTATTTFLLSVMPYSGTGEYSYGWGPGFIQIWEIAQ